MSFHPGPKVAAGLSLAAGGLAAIAFPPFGVLPGILGYGLLMHLVDETPGRRPFRSAFWRGWLAAFAYFLIGCWWVAEAFMVDAKGQGWMAPFAVALLPAGMGLFWGTAMVVYRALRPSGPLRILAFAGVLTGFEWLRGHVLTGFPWNLPGETWAAGSPISQAASVVGAYGLTWITVAVAAAMVAPLGDGDRCARWAPLGAAAVALALLAGYGTLRLSHAAPPRPDAPIIRVVQPNVPQLAKYDARSFRDIVDRYVALTAKQTSRAPDVVVWSEGAIPDSANDFLAPGTWTQAAIRRALHPGETLLLGAYREASGPAGAPIYFNSLIALRDQPDGLEVTGVYDKHRLVPFGEYLPAERILAPLGFKDLTHIGDSFSFGPPPSPIRPEGLPPVQPLICYESLYPGFTRAGALRSGVRPSWIVNVSNDAWFGRTSGPIQHLNLASYRAIEEGMPIVRATPTGVSAIIDAYGRIVPGAKLGLSASGVIDAPLPPALRNTTYSRLGELSLAGLLTLSALTLYGPLTSAIRKILSTSRIQ